MRLSLLSLVLLSFSQLLFSCSEDKAQGQNQQEPAIDTSSIAAQPDTSSIAEPAKVSLLDTITLPSWIPQDPAALRKILTGRLDPAKDSNFIVLPKGYTDKGGPYYMRREAADALIQMIDEAKKQGIRLVVISAARNFDRQSQIWSAKWRGERTLSNGVNLAQTNMPDSAKARMILLYSSMPGTSRHHWGTDIDLNSLEDAYFQKGKGAKEYAWLRKNAHKFGFHQPYTKKDQGRTGYEEEKWHWSYAPLARPLAELYRRHITYEDISGFAGSEIAPQVKAIEEYVYGLGDGLELE